MHRDWHPQRGASVQRVLCTSKRAGFTVQRALCTSKGEGLTVQKASPFPWDPQKLATNSLKFQVTKNGPKVDKEPAWQDFLIWTKFSTHFNNRVRIDELGADFGGEVPRAEGGRGAILVIF